MEFESRFRSLFKEESQLPQPIQLAFVKRRKSFSDKFFKSSSGSTLKLSSKHALKIRQKLAFREKPVAKELASPSNYENGETGDTKIEVDERKGIGNDFKSSFLFSSPRSLSGSVEYLPISENVDSYLPVSSHSSVITLSKFNTFKVPSNKFGTFGREQAINSSPYGRIFKGRLNRSRLEINSLNLDEPDTPNGSLSSYTLPVTPFLDSSIASSVSVAESLNDLKANFYGQGADQVSLPRTDFSCRISPIYGKNAKESLSALKFLSSDSSVRLSKQIETPKITNSASNGLQNGSVSSDDFSDQSEGQDNETEDTEHMISEPKDKEPKYNKPKDSEPKDNETKTFCSYDTRVINDFHSELLAKCKRIKNGGYAFKSMDGINVCSVNVPNKNETLANGFKTYEASPSHFSKLSNISKPEIFPKPNMRSKSDLALRLKSGSRSRLVSMSGKDRLSSISKPKQISPKPNSSLKPDISIKTDISPDFSLKPDVSPKPDISPKPAISPKPDISPKPKVPGKPERLKNMEISKQPCSFKFKRRNNSLPEINNNLLSVQNGINNKGSLQKLNDEFNQKYINDVKIVCENGLRSDSNKGHANGISDINEGYTNDVNCDSNKFSVNGTCSDSNKSYVNGLSANNKCYVKGLTEDNKCNVNGFSANSNNGYVNSVNCDSNKEYVKSVNCDTNEGYVNSENSYNSKACINSNKVCINGVTSESDDQSEKMQNGLKFATFKRSVSCETKVHHPIAAISVNREHSGTLRVRDIVASFNEVLSFSNKDDGGHTLSTRDYNGVMSSKFKMAQRSSSFQRISSKRSPKKAFSEWNLSNVQNRNKISGKSGSLSENLNHHKFQNIVPVTGRNTPRSEI